MARYPGRIKMPVYNESEVNRDKVEAALVAYLRAATGIDLADPALIAVDFRKSTISFAAAQDGKRAADDHHLNPSEDIAVAFRLIGAGPKVVPHQTERFRIEPSAIQWQPQQTEGEA